MSAQILMNFPKVFTHIAKWLEKVRFLSQLIRQILTRSRTESSPKMYTLFAPRELSSAGFIQLPIGNAMFLFLNDG